MDVNIKVYFATFVTLLLADYDDVKNRYILLSNLNSLIWIENMKAIVYLRESKL